MDLMMRSLLSFVFGVLAAAALAAPAALSADLPPIKLAPSNAVPKCVTPGRLMAFLGARNKKLDPRFGSVAAEYMRHGDALGLRWDIAFFQMLLETGNLTYTGDVKPQQNNFAGLGATGGGARGESFADVSSGVLAHLQHVLVYAGERVENPIAERTRKIQDWKIVDKSFKGVSGPRTYAQIAKLWADGSPGYSRDIASIASAFMTGPCLADDPRPEMAQAAPGGSAAPPAAASDAETARPSAEGAPPAEADAPPNPSAVADAGVSGDASPPPGAAPGEPKSGSTKGLDPAPGVGDAGDATRVAAAQQAAASPPVSVCRVWTASYGGSKAIIIKATLDKTVNYTVLDVNEGKEKREAEAYIAAYAKGGETVGEFASQTQALDKAFELCPEGSPQ